jgi:spore photoproduct lyase
VADVGCIDKNYPLSFEMIQYRFTSPAKEKILSRFPNTKLDMDETKKKVYEKHGINKYVYKYEDFNPIKKHIHSLIDEHFPNAKIHYCI